MFNLHPIPVLFASISPQYKGENAQSDEKWKESTYHPEVNSSGPSINDITVNDEMARGCFFKNPEAEKCDVMDLLMQLKEDEKKR
ncbi:hypothetical protein RYX36_019508 [Vicia faba]